MENLLLDVTSCDMLTNNLQTANKCLPLWSEIGIQVFFDALKCKNIKY